MAKAGKHNTFYLLANIEDGRRNEKGKGFCSNVAEEGWDGTMDTRDRLVVARVNREKSLG